VRAFGEGLGFCFGFSGAGVSGYGGGLGAAAGGFCLGDLDADTGRIEAGSLLAGGLDQDGSLPGQGLEAAQRVLTAAAGAGGRSGEAGVVVVAAGAVVAAELPGPAAAGCWQRLAAARAPALGRGKAGCRVAAAGGMLAGHGGCLLVSGTRDGFSFHF
jgi:hypothetical protein